MKSCPKCSAECPLDTSSCWKCGESLEGVDPREDVSLVGQTVAGSFRVLDRIGTGAMGAIYRVEQLSLGKVVALKVLHRHLLADPTLIRRFHREARAASRLNHRNCISILDFGQAESGELFIAMEYIDGKDLADTLYEEFPLDLRRVFHITMSVCDALDEAHAHGVIHRDLKPENIMLATQRNEQEVVTVLDFGIAKIQDVERSGEHSWQTLAGMVCGTPEFMSPEQIRGETLDARSDLYSLGVILYQLVTNELPFTGDAPLAVVTRHLTDPTPHAVAKRPDLPPRLNDLIVALMSKKREGRPATALEVRAELVRISEMLYGREQGGRRKLTEDREVPVESATQPAADSDSSVTWGRPETTPSAPAGARGLLTMLVLGILLGSLTYLAWKITLGSSTVYGDEALTQVVGHVEPGVSLNEEPSVQVEESGEAEGETEPAEEEGPPPATTGTSEEEPSESTEADSSRNAARSEAVEPNPRRGQEARPTTADAAGPGPSTDEAKPLDSVDVSEAAVLRARMESSDPGAAGTAKIEAANGPDASSVTTENTATPPTRAPRIEETADSDRAQRIRSLEEEARSLQMAGRHRAAAERLQRLWRLQPRTRTLKRIGQAFGRARDRSKACEFFGRYLERLAPAARGRELQALALYQCNNL